MRLPLQNLWDAGTLPGDMPIVLLPFSQHAITRIIGLLVVGAVAAGIAARALRPRLPRRGSLALFGGLLLVQVVAVVQTSIVVGAGLREHSASGLYLALLGADAVLAMLVGAAAFWLVAAAPRAGALVGLAIGALASGPWLLTLLAPIGTVTPDWLLGVLPGVLWIPPILVGVAIAWCGLRTAGRIGAALFGILLVWVVPALETGIGNAAAVSRLLAPRPAEMLDYGVGVFRAALTVPELAVRPILIAVGATVVGLLVGLLIRRGRAAGQAQRT